MVLPILQAERDIMHFDVNVEKHAGRAMAPKGIFSSTILQYRNLHALYVYALCSQ